MDTIRSYLESMFKNLPQTEAVIKAKYELGQMMEDKYTELIKEGKSENEAVGTVIAEFGNLEEIATDLGIEEILKSNRTEKANRRKLSLEKIKQYLNYIKNYAILKGIGIALCISCVTGPIISDTFDLNEVFSSASLFLILTAGIICIILGKSQKEEWQFISTQACSIDQLTVDYVKNIKREFNSTYSILVSIGTLLIVFCFIPAIIFSETKSDLLNNLSGALFFWFISAGTFLIYFAKKIRNGYITVLSINSSDNIFWDSHTYTEQKPKQPLKYHNSTQKLIMEIFWPTTLCIYLCWSFLTFSWFISWIIWPIAAVLHPTLKHVFTEQEEK